MQIIIGIFYFGLFVLGLYNTYGYLFKMSKWKDVPMSLFYFNAQGSLLCSVIFVPVSPYFKQSRTSLIISQVCVYLSLTMGVCYLMIIIELWIRMKYAMQEIHQIKHRKHFQYCLRFLYTLTILINLTFYFLCYWYATQIITLLKDAIETMTLTAAMK